MTRNRFRGELSNNFYKSTHAGYGNLKTLARLTGYIGECIACRWLQSRGHSIVARNVRFKNGEIDIVSLKQSVLIAYEVKTRRYANTCKITPLEAMALTIALASKITSAVPDIDSLPPPSAAISATKEARIDNLCRQVECRFASLFRKKRIRGVELAAIEVYLYRQKNQILYRAAVREFNL